ncbi:Tetratricopeptide-like helical domain superfamily [Sesbania bispinosa]|nr:Tetratricopeptide-like helical domain superfamily [Sesbania bispinosa]
MESSSGRESNGRVPLSGVVADCVKRWFKDTLKEAKAGDINMQVLVGQMYYSGYGVPKDAQKGRIWLTKASRIRSSVWKVGDKHPGGFLGRLNLVSCLNCESQPHFFTQIRKPCSLTRSISHKIPNGCVSANETQNQGTQGLARSTLSRSLPLSHNLLVLISLSVSHRFWFCAPHPASGSLIRAICSALLLLLCFYSADSVPPKWLLKEVLDLVV